MDKAAIEKAQMQTCQRHGRGFVSADSEILSGFALSTRGRVPINGMRNPLTETTTGWYVWCGEEFSDAGDFFSPVCTKHIYEEIPEIASLFGLEPGSRFLVAGDYVDVWFDRELLTVG